MSIKDSNFSKQSLISISGNVLVLLFSFVGSIIIARSIGPSGYGQLYYILAISAVLANFVEGWSVACGKKQSEEFFDSDIAISTSLTFAFLFSILCVVFLILYSYIIDMHTYIITMITIVLIGKSFHLSTYQAFKSTEKYGYESYIIFIKSILRVVLQLALLGLGFGLTGLVVGFVLGDLLTSTFLIIKMDYNLKKPPRNKIIEIYNFARYSIPSKFVTHSFDKIDLVMLFILSTSAIAGNYQTAVQISLPAMITSSSLSSSLRTKISNSHSRDKDFSSILKTSINYASFISIPMFFGSLIVGEELVKLVYTESFAIGGILIPYVILIKLIISQRSLYQSSLNAINKPYYSVVANGIGFLINVILGIILFIQYNYIGIIIASIIATLISYILSFYYLNKSIQYDFNIITKNLGLQFVSAIIMVLIVYTAKTITSGDKSIIILVLIGGIVYLISYFILVRVYLGKNLIKQISSKVL
jgi:O-antigen/teichoic acid export membrane protein